MPHLHSIFFRTQSIADWREATAGLTPSEVAFHITGQELLGAIEPQIGAGTRHGGGSDEAFTPIPERIDHLADRAAAWIRLARLANARKKVALVYYDCDLGKAELMRGTATGMFMNGPRSMVNVLKRLQREGYGVAPVPADENELIAWLMDRGPADRRVGAGSPRSPGPQRPRRADPRRNVPGLVRVEGAGEAAPGGHRALGPAAGKVPRLAA